MGAYQQRINLLTVQEQSKEREIEEVRQRGGRGSGRRIDRLKDELLLIVEELGSLHAELLNLEIRYHATRLGVSEDELRHASRHGPPNEH